MNERSLTIPGDLGGIPATMATPPGDGPFPAVVLLHGTASHRDEVGGMFARLAAALAARGVASLRIDFAGCGASTLPQTDLTVTSEVADARTAYRWLADHDDVDAARIGVLGFSQGGMIATLLTRAEPGLAALAWWSSGPASPFGHPFAGLAPAFAGDADPVLVDVGFARFTFSRTWWEEVQNMDLPAALAAFDRPILGLAGGADTVIDIAASAAALRKAPGTDVTVTELPGADHIFNVLDPDSDQSTPVVVTTADWFADRLAAVAPDVMPMSPAEAELMTFADYEFPRPEELDDRVRFHDGLVARIQGHRPLMIDVDVPRPSDGRPVPVVVWLHGGAWMWGTNKHTATPIDTERIREELLAAGIAFASVQYRLSGESRWPAQLHDIKSAVRWLRHHADRLGIDPERVAAWGESAGGHLAALLATTGDRPDLEGHVGVTTGTSRIQAAVSWYGPTDLAAMVENGFAAPAYELLGGRTELARQASPLHHVGGGTAPMLLIHGTDDTPVPADHSRRLADACTEHGVPVELVLVPDAGHAFAGTDHVPYIARSVLYLARALRGDTSDPAPGQLLGTP
ncbi:alpha/beta hydrolase family protein [Yinghuangia seranimata]|uniref:alpha/beta hydrolase family protein n=1 Tax=Yinghuangia seranimata TaxID=408067 RepID=UPI00248B117B|nr:alpha/beta fold hydrolase [Yinghuangia seranimata]MDI2130111.1 alpha/beta fold hydrolase [Yinghuangia seranimata]